MTRFVINCMLYVTAECIHSVFNYLGVVSGNERLLKTVSSFIMFEQKINTFNLCNFQNVFFTTNYPLLTSCNPISSNLF